MSCSILSIDGAIHQMVDVPAPQVHSGRLSVSRGGTPERPLLHMDLPVREPTDPVPSGITAESDVVTVCLSSIWHSHVCHVSWEKHRGSALSSSGLMIKFQRSAVEP